MQKIIVGNLKMNILTIVERDEYLESFEKEIRGKKIGDVEIALCVPVLHLETFVKKLSKVVSLGAQNFFWEEKGSFTGETSPLAVKNFGADFAIVGHSERRRYFFETNEDANAKTKLALKNNLKVIYCVGETKEEREGGEMAEVISAQISKGLENIEVEKLSQVVVAYEPVWSVGSDVLPTSGEILEVKILIKKILSDMFGISEAEKVRIIYGGSVKAESVKQVCFDPEMDGVLVGRESLNPKELIRIAEIIAKK